MESDLFGLSSPFMVSRVEVDFASLIDEVPSFTNHKNWIWTLQFSSIPLGTRDYSLIGPTASFRDTEMDPWIG